MFGVEVFAGKEEEDRWWGNDDFGVGVWIVKVSGQIAMLLFVRWLEIVPVLVVEMFWTMSLMLDTVPFL